MCIWSKQRKRVEEKRKKKPTVSEVSQGKGGVVAAGKRTVKRVRGVGLGCKVGGW